MVTRILAVALLFLIIGGNRVLAYCADNDENIRACAKQTLMRTNVVIGGVISDPNGGKMKAARSNCEAECNIAHELFISRFGK